MSKTGPATKIRENDLKPRKRGAGTAEAPRCRRIGLMQLDVSAPAVSGRGARSIRTQIVERALGGRGVDNCAVGIGQADVELVVNTGFSRVPGANSKVYVTELVRPGRAADLPRTGGLMRLRVRTVAAIIPKEVPRNAGPMNV